jgi:hypothetical protein
MPISTIDSSASATAAAATTATPHLSLGAALNKMHWDAALALVMASDPYYHYLAAPTASTASAGNDDTTKTTTAAAAAAPPPREHCFCRYMCSSSKVRLLIHASVVGYLLYVLTHPSRYVPCHVMVSTDSASTMPAATDCYLYQSAEGMQLLMRGKMPKLSVVLHAVAGSLLLPLAIAQKESVWYMPFAAKAVPGSEATTTTSTITRTAAGAAAHESAAAHSEAKRVNLRHARVSRRYHGNCGFLTGACVFAMVTGGVSLRSYSVFSLPETSARAGILNFASAMFLFAAPWVALTPATALSGANAKAAAHAMVGGVLIKAVLAVPFERMLGGLWQRWAGVRVSLPPRRWFSKEAASEVAVTQHMEGELERVYYKSILVTTILFGAWGVVDIIRFLTLAKKCVVLDERAKKAA